MPETRKSTLPVVALAREHEEFRKVVRTGDNTRLVPMAIPERGEIGGEVHAGRDRLLYLVAGSEVAKPGETGRDIAERDVSIVPSGDFHDPTGVFQDCRNTGSGMMKLVTTCSPREQEPGTEHASRAQADDDA